MANTYLKVQLSGSVNGKNIVVTTTSGSYTNIHTAISSSASFDLVGTDEVWLYAYNSSTSSVTMSLLWGSVTESNDVNRWILPPAPGGVNGTRTLLVDGKILQNSLTILAYASIANVVLIDGFVNRVQ